jgi:branched-chain amino acid transport system substrate-binding protein
MRLRPASLLIISLLMLTVAACGGGTGGEASGGAGGEPIRIGASLPLTGDLAEPGKEAKRGYDVWLEIINDQGGLLGRPVEMIVRDDGSDQNTVVADYNHLIARERVDLLLGTFSSFLNLPASAVAERNAMVYVEPAGGSPEMFNRGFEFLFFAQQATAPHQADEFSAWLGSLPEAERPATAAYISLDDPFTEPVISGMRSQLEPHGIETVYNKVYPQGTTNFDTIANAIKASGAELVSHGATSLPDGAGIVRALIRAGHNPDYFFQTTAPSLAQQYADAIGVENTEGVFYAVSYSPEADTRQNTEFLEVYEGKYDAIPAEDAADAFATAQVLQTAVEEVGEIDQEAIADWLRENSVDTILGTISWDETGAPEQSFLLGQWQNGRSEIILPEGLATTDTVVKPKPAWSK